MYYLLSNIKIPNFDTDIPDVLAVSKHTVKPYLRAKTFLFHTVDYDYEEFKFSDDAWQNDFTSTTSEQQMDFNFDPANYTIYKGLAAKTYKVKAAYPNMLVVYISDQQLKDADNELDIAIYDVLNSYLPIYFIYSYAK